MKIFISYAKPFHKDQELFLNNMLKYLKTMSVETVLIKNIHYSYQCPLDPVIEAIKDCDGVIAIAFERSHIYLGTSKEGSDECHEYTHRHQTSPWIHMEIAIAYSLNKPILILKQKCVYSDGVLDGYKLPYSIINLVDEVDDCNPFYNPILDFNRQQESINSINDLIEYLTQSLTL